MKIETQTLQHLQKEDFLIKNNLTESDFINSKLDWNELLKIGIAHAERTNFLKDTAVLLSSVLQQVNEVHSVRWRVKDPEHLMEKIVRKRNEASEKYNEISENNYSDIVTDLIGIRVLHLFKKDWEPIHDFIRSKWKLSEEPVVYIREGDDSESEESNASDEYSMQGYSVKVHKAGYRSAHYITTTRPMKDEIFTEIQVRTIFEEGWSEIDHRVRYPNFSDNELLNYFLSIFNRFSGSADEMGSFVLDLRETIELMEYSKSELSKIEDEKEESLQKIDELIAKLSSEEKKVGRASSELQQLKKEITALKRKEEITSSKNKLNSLGIFGNHHENGKMSNDIQHHTVRIRDASNASHKIKTKSHSTDILSTANERLKSVINSNNGMNKKILLEILGGKAVASSLELENPPVNSNFNKNTNSKTQKKTGSTPPLNLMVSESKKQLKKN